MHPDREVVSVTAELQPLVLETMSKFKDKQEVSQWHHAVLVLWCLQME